MFRAIFCSIGLILTSLLCQTAAAGEITPAGEKLAQFLDQTNVEKLWLPKHYVNWETGKALEKPVTDNKPHTHCSAFAAAVAQRLDIYLLRPPEHSASFLANAQFDWLKDEGTKKGWKVVKGPKEAQQLANKGQLVLAVFKEADPKKHGHIAVVRPSTKSDKLIEEEGPQIIQAGMDNFLSASLKEGFKHHPTAFKDDGIRYYSHKVDLK